MANKPQSHPQTNRDPSPAAAHPEIPGLGSAGTRQHTRWDPEQRWEGTARPGQPRQEGMLPIGGPGTSPELLCPRQFPKSAPGCSGCRCAEAWKSHPPGDIQEDVPRTGTSRCSGLGAHPKTGQREGGKRTGEEPGGLAGCER